MISATVWSERFPPDGKNYLQMAGGVNLDDDALITS
jgi:hypothetical protein